jgi:hypothetical protein
MTYVTRQPCPVPDCRGRHGVTSDRLPGRASTRTPLGARTSEAPVASTGSDPAVPQGAAVSDDAAGGSWARPDLALARG